MKKIIFATGNAGKMKEIREILADLQVEIQSMKEAGIEADIVENGSTFDENARIKAESVAKELPEGEQAIVLADDSGLEIDWLFGPLHGRGYILSDQECESDFPSGGSTGGETDSAFCMCYCSCSSGRRGINYPRRHRGQDRV